MIRLVGSIERGEQSEILQASSPAIPEALREEIVLLPRELSSCCAYMRECKCVKVRASVYKCVQVRAQSRTNAYRRAYMRE